MGGGGLERNPIIHRCPAKYVNKLQSHSSTILMKAHHQGGTFSLEHKQTFQRHIAL